MQQIMHLERFYSSHGPVLPRKAHKSNDCRDRPGRHFLTSTKSEYLDVPFAGSGYEPSTICLDIKKLFLFLKYITSTFFIL